VLPVPGWALAQPNYRWKNRLSNHHHWGHAAKIVQCNDVWMDMRAAYLWANNLQLAEVVPDL
jgi:hypothetical protein